MSEQLTFAEFDPPRSAPPTDRLFLATLPDVAAREQIAGLTSRLRREHGLTGEPLAMERLHVSLTHLGDHVGDPPAAFITAARRAAGDVAALPFTVTFDHVVSFSKPREAALVLRGGDGLDSLMAFHRGVNAALTHGGFGAFANPRFTPHVTLLYDARKVKQQFIEPVTWTVSEFVLIRSLLGQTKHVVIGRWKLLG